MKATLLFMYHHILDFKSKFLIKIMKPDYSVTYFEGGLGSQILSFIEFMNKSRIYGTTVGIDTSYFRDNTTYHVDNGLSHFEYKLNNYGIYLSNLNQKMIIGSENESGYHLRKKMKSNLRRLYFGSRRPTHIESVKYIIENKLWTVSESMYGYFPIVSSQKQRDLIFFDGVETLQYGLIHIRKGDYLNVASRILTVHDILPSLEIVKNYFPKKVICVTDGLFSESEKIQLQEVLRKGSVETIVFHEGAIQFVDPTVLHDLMRCANFLVTSNSTFSFSAGLLNRIPDSIILIPITFYGDLGNDTSLAFRTRATFGLLERQ